jgi:hypothetical protein
MRGTKGEFSEIERENVASCDEEGGKCSVFSVQGKGEEPRMDANFEARTFSPRLLPAVWDEWVLD